MKKARIGKALALRDRKLLKLGPDCELGQVERRRRSVHFRSKADMCAAKRHVCFTPNSDRESEIPQKAMAALPPTADMCSANAHVCFGPKADIQHPPRTDILCWSGPYACRRAAWTIH
jgi:hypothetical protein